MAWLFFSSEKIYYTIVLMRFSDFCHVQRENINNKGFESMFISAVRCKNQPHTYLLSSLGAASTVIIDTNASKDAINYIAGCFASNAL